MAEVQRLHPAEARKKVPDGEALLICASEDDAGPEDGDVKGWKKEGFSATLGKE